MPDRVGEAAGFAPDVSVLIAAYNCEHTIRRAVRSALDQDGVSIEVCIGFDAGPEASWQAVKQQADHAVYVLSSKTNRGPGAMMQECARWARGRYLILLGDDDWLEPGALQPLVHALDTDTSLSMAYGATKFWGRRSDRYTPPPFSRDDFYTGFPSLYGYLYRREGWERSDGYRDEFEADGRWLGAPDWDMALQVLEQGSGICLPDVLVLNHLLAPGRMTEIVGRRGGDVLASMKARHPKLEAVSL